MASAPRVNPAEVAFSAIRAQGPGGQNVNKVSCAVQARYDVRASSLPAAIQERLLARADARLSGEGVLVIKAQEHRSQLRNQAEALARLQALVDEAAEVPRTRRPTQPTRGSKRRRLDGKSARGAIKSLRGRCGADG